MDVYWSIERCGWVPCKGPADPLATPWSLAAEPAVAPGPVPDMPLQRTDSARAGRAVGPAER